MSLIAGLRGGRLRPSDGARLRPRLLGGDGSGRRRLHEDGLRGGTRLVKLNLYYPVRVLPFTGFSSEKRTKLRD